MKYVEALRAAFKWAMHNKAVQAKLSSGGFSASASSPARTLSCRRAPPLTGVSRRPAKAALASE